MLGCQKWTFLNYFISNNLMGALNCKLTQYEYFYASFFQNTDGILNCIRIKSNWTMFRSDQYNPIENSTLKKSCVRKLKCIFSLRREDLISRCCPSVCLSVGPLFSNFSKKIGFESNIVYCLIRPSLYCLIHFSKRLRL